ncbi:MAG: NAD(P)-dependent oxidoreductase [Planctomycetota bacterium]
MKILFTGASSFTGCWFVRELAAAGHEIVMAFRRDLGQYTGLRRTRVEMLLEDGRGVFNCSFGDSRFLELVKEESGWDLLCHHAAEVADYRSPNFDVVAAVRNNTLHLGDVLSALRAKGCSKVLLTGSVFEGGEGAGSDGLRAFSPYGLSKALTAQVVTYYTEMYGMRLGKFVIANPFGPYEEPRFTAYLVRSWYEGQTPSVSTPDYVRDNVHVPLLAKAYVDFVARLPAAAGFCRASPSGYVESQGAFAQRFARNMHDKLGLPCMLELKTQSEFPEPRIRINTEPIDGKRLGWDEARAWDELAEYYKQVHATERSTR